MRVRTAAVFGSIIASAALLHAASDGTICGTQRTGTQEALYLNRLGVRAQFRDLAAHGLTFLPKATDRDHGNIAVIDGSGGVLVERNSFDLTGRTLRFERQSDGQYRMSVLPGSYSPEDASAGTPLDLTDDDATPVAIPFEFPFYNSQYRRIFVHSDGNVTFYQPDLASAPRDTGRLHAGPARIAALFTDLDPSQAPGSVRVAASDAAIVVTWLDTPVFSEFGAGVGQTFQLRLEPSGAIELTWLRVTATSSVVGISPGYLAGEVTLRTLSESDGTVFPGVLAESFQTGTSVDIVRAAQRFYETHPDVYDYIVMFNATGTPIGPGILAATTPIRQTRHGLGDTLVDLGWAFGSLTRLQAFLNMGPLNQYPQDPLALVPGRGEITGDTTLSILGHEAGHLFLALASVRDPNDPERRPMLGAAQVHWSFNYNSDASLLEGNRIEPAPGAGDSFLTTATVQGYSPLDQYLMGFRAPDEVPPSFLIDPASRPASRLPQTGVAITGARRDIAIGEIVDAVGPRIPEHAIAQRAFSFAFVLLVAPGQTATEAQVAQIDRYRRDFEAYFHAVSDQRGWAFTELRNSLRFSAWPATGVVAGETGVATIDVDEPVEQDLAVGIWAPQGLVEAPPEVIIPRGRRSVSFAFRGLAPGISDMTAEARAGHRAVVYAKAQVFPSRDDLRLIVHYTGGSNPGPIVLRVAAGKEVNVSNVPIRVTAPGEVRLIEGRNTDFRTLPDGLMWFWWTPPPEGGTLDAEIDGLPGTRITIDASDLVRP